MNFGNSLYFDTLNTNYYISNNFYEKIVLLKEIRFHKTIM